MANIILKRDDFINEVYSRGNENELNEGILDFVRTLFRGEWKKVKTDDTQLRDKLEEVDRNLKGFAATKLKKSGPCALIRQALCDFASTLLKSKKKEFEDGIKLQKLLMSFKDKDDISYDDKRKIQGSSQISDYMKQFDIKDKSLAEKLKIYVKRINDATDGDEELVKWADIMLDEIKLIVNDEIIRLYDKTENTEKKDRETEKAKEEAKKEKEAREKLIKTTDDDLSKEALKKIKEIAKERKDALTGIGVTPITLNAKDGVKTYDQLKTEFNNILNLMGISVNESKVSDALKNLFDSISEFVKKNKTKKIKEVFNNDNFLGFKNFIDDKIDKKLLKTFICEVKVAFDAIDVINKNNDNKYFTNIPSDAVQALCAGLVCFIGSAIFDRDLDDNTKTLLARCAVGSDNTIGYGLPYLDDENKQNIFVEVIQKINDVDPQLFGNDNSLVSKFKKKITEFSNIISDTAKKLKGEED